ncbi:hypothetical protein [Chromobacterium haemolyticum]|uniref:hypothetical protein n=1 Tax=Chromobacterium haemolyticum TaxID=394935 RepID=UPI0012DF303A|nr:hypothetical protein [Chromobacterium haemolyticum]
MTEIKAGRRILGRQGEERETSRKSKAASSGCGLLLCGNIQIAIKADKLSNYGWLQFFAHA